MEVLLILWLKIEILYIKSKNEVLKIYLRVACFIRFE